MAFDWPDYLALARGLAYADDEASHRSAISRAYYACYGLARRSLPVEPGPVASFDGEHKALWDEYKSAQERARRAIGTNGDRMRRKRNLADYEIAYSDAAHDVAGVLQEAERICAKLQRS